MYKIMVIDDSRSVLPLVKYILDKEMDLEINYETCTSNIKDMDKLNTLTFDLIMVNIYMSDINGQDLISLVSRITSVPIMAICPFPVSNHTQEALQVAVNNGAKYILHETNIHQELPLIINETVNSA